jgi:vancomycin resistance protein VanJ
MTTLLGSGLSWGALIYSVGLTGLALFWMVGDGGAWWLRLSDIFAIYLFAPLPLLILSAVFVRSLPLRAASGVLLALFLLEFGVRLLPPPGAMAEGRSLRVLTFNHLYTNRRASDIVAAIRAQDADIVGLQELSALVAGQIDRDLADRYPYRYLLPEPQSYGLGLLSRYPIVQQRLVLPLSAQEVVVDIAGMQVTVLNVHMPSPQVQFGRIAPRMLFPSGYNDTRRARAAPRLLQHLDTISGPLIALGDFNTSEREPLYDQIAARLQDSYRRTSWGIGATFPRLQRQAILRVIPPLVRIDYIWTREQITPARTWVNCDVPGSDHCMLGADLRLDLAAAQLLAPERG